MKSFRSVPTRALLLLLVIISPAIARAQSPASEQEIERRVEEIAGKMTLEEKVDYISGVDGFYIRAVPRLGLPALKMADGPVGVRNFGPATAYAAGIGLAATWNPELARRVGVELGRDARAKGVHFLLGPGVNIYRSPLNGRNFEYFGEDPLLGARIAVGYISGVQSQGVSATIKHFIANNSEFDRHRSDAIIDERTLREIYLPIFEAGVKDAHVGAIMDAYNLVNGSHMTQHAFLNTDVVRKDWGFRGIMMSDWVATYDAIAAANGGLDLEMPSGMFFNRQNLLPAVEQGKVSVATIDEKVKRILRTAIRFGWFDREQTDLGIPRFSQSGQRVALDAAHESIVLLKNEQLLPLDKTKIKAVAIIGPNAYPAVPEGGGSARVEPFVAVSMLEGLTRVLGSNVTVYYHQGIPGLNELAQNSNFVTETVNGKPGLKVDVYGNYGFTGTPIDSHVDQHVNFAPGAPSSQFFTPPREYSARWTGYYVADKLAEYEVFTETTRERGSGIRLFVDDKLVFDGWTRAGALLRNTTMSLTPGPHKILLEQFRQRATGGNKIRFGIVARAAIVDANAKALAARADVVIAAVGFDSDIESEGADRAFELPLGQDVLIEELAAANKQTIVAVTSGGSVDMRRWVAKVPALLQLWYPGQEGGIALAETLFGAVNPSGRLPVTFEQRWEDNPSFATYYPAAAGTDRVEYSEGVFIGYRGYEQKKIKPQFPFGFGLSYTTFSYADLKIKEIDKLKYEVTFDVQNTGKLAGADVAQVYVAAAAAPVPRPAQELKGLAKVFLAPGEKKRVTVVLDGRSFAFYDVNSKHWHVTSGSYGVAVGRSSQDMTLRGEVKIAADAELQ